MIFYIATVYISPLLCHTRPVAMVYRPCGKQRLRANRGRSYDSWYYVVGSWYSCSACRVWSFLFWLPLGSKFINMSFQRFSYRSVVL